MGLKLSRLCIKVYHISVFSFGHKKSVLDFIRYEHLNWYCHVLRMNEERLPRKKKWMQEITGIRVKEINNVHWIDKGKWRRKIKLQEQKDVKTLILCS